MKRRHELITHQCFDSFLANKYPDSERFWEEPINDPPDWFLTIEKKRFAVEATSITDQISIGHSVVPSPAINNSLSDFVDEIESRAKERGILSGGYFIALAPIPNLHEHKEDLILRFLQYIEDTQTEPSPEEYSLGYVGHNKISISKVTCEQNYIGEIIQFDSKWEGEAQEKLDELLKGSLDTKISKLDQIDEPIVLLILDAYQYSEITSWKKAIDSIPSRNSYSAIARINPPDNCHIIWSTKEWINLYNST